MGRELLFPDYNKSVINVMSSILGAYEIKPTHNPLELLPLDSLWSKKNIVLMVLDGLGYDLLMNQSLVQTAFLRDNLLGEITSVYPSTTTAAITSILTEQTPLEHGALGWTLFFKEYMKFVDFLPLTDHSDGKLLPYGMYNMHEFMEFNTVFTKMAKYKPSLRLHSVMPAILAESSYTHSTSDPAIKNGYNSVNDMMDTIVSIVKENDARKFIYCYSMSPDDLEHKYGVESELVSDYISTISAKLEQMSRTLEGTDTTILLLADHGLVNMSEYYCTSQNNELYKTLVLPTFPEPRFCSFFVKNHRKAEFETVIERYRKDFMILERKEFLEKGLLGDGTPHDKIDDFLGDYICMGTTDKGMISEYMLSDKFVFKGMHGGLTREEMAVPLVRIDM